MNSKNQEMARRIVETALPLKLSTMRLATENSTLFLEEIAWGSAKLLLWIDMELQENGTGGKNFVLTCRLRAKDMDNPEALPVTREVDLELAKQAIQQNESPIRACLAASPEGLEQIRSRIPSVQAICTRLEMGISVGSAPSAPRRRGT